MTFNAYEMSAPFALTASRKAVRRRASTLQLPCEFDTRAENVRACTVFAVRNVSPVRLNVRLTCADRTEAVPNRAFPCNPKCSYKVLSPCEARTCPLLIQNEGKS